METGVIDNHLPLPLSRSQLLPGVDLGSLALAGQVDGDGERGTELSRETIILIKIVPPLLPRKLEPGVCV